MYERFTDRARRVMQLANQEAQRTNHEFIDSSHVLIGLIKEGSGIGAETLRKLNPKIELGTVRREIEKVLPPGPEMVTMGKMPMNPSAKEVIQRALKQAEHFKHNHVGTEHLLLGLLHQAAGNSRAVLSALGITEEEVEQEVGKIAEKHALEPLPETQMIAAVREVVADFTPALADVTPELDGLRRVILAACDLTETCLVHGAGMRTFKTLIEIARKQEPQPMVPDDPGKAFFGGVKTVEGPPPGWVEAAEPIGNIVCSKCGKVQGVHAKSKYCGDGSNKEDEHRWVREVPK